jgi:hypothetical protein
MTMFSGISVQVSAFWSLAPGHGPFIISEKTADKTLKLFCVTATATRSKNLTPDT